MKFKISAHSVGYLEETIEAKNEEEILREVISFAKEHNVELVYESNKRFFGSTCLDFLKRFPHP
jgi:hypothetical protein